MAALLTSLARAPALLSLLLYFCETLGYCTHMFNLSLDKNPAVSFG